MDTDVLSNAQSHKTSKFLSGQPLSPHSDSQIGADSDTIAGLPQAQHAAPRGSAARQEC